MLRFNSREMGKEIDDAPKQPNGNEFSDDGEKNTYDTGEVSWATRMKINPKLVPLKLLMLLIHGGMAALYPYLTLHMRSIGLTFVEIGVIYAILPFVCAIGPTIGGAIADKLGNYKMVMIATIMLSNVSHMLMWFAVPNMPPATELHHYNVTTLVGRFPCGADQSLPMWVHNLTDQDCFAPIQNNTYLTFKECHTDCQAKDASQHGPAMCFLGREENECFTWTDLAYRHLSNVQFENTSISNNSIMIESFVDEYQRDMTWVTCSHTRNCSISCTAQTNLALTCVRPTFASRIKTLALYITFRYIAGIAVSTVIPILDAVAYQMSEDYNGDLGFQRMFSLIGLCTLPPLSGFLIGVASKTSHYEDYSPAFYIFGAMNIISIFILAFCMTLTVRIPAVDIMKNVGKILRNPKVFTFILMMFLAGVAWGFLENYLFLFMKKIGSPEWLFGMTSTVSGLAAIPVVAASTIIMKYLGHTKIVMICFLFYGCRFLAYAHIYNPYHVLPVEILEAITTSLLWVVASVYCGKIAPDYLATLQGVIGTMHYALGRGAGSLLGGVMFDYFKERVTYKIFGWSCIGIGVFYAVLHYTWLRNIARVEMAEDEIEEGPEEIKRLPSLRRGLSRKEENDLVQSAKFTAFTPLGMTFSGRSLNSSIRSAPDHASIRNRHSYPQANNPGD